jgi:hypothetical protein
MAITLNDNIKINAGKPSEPKYLTTGNTAYVSTASVFAEIPVALRYVGLTVLMSGTSNQNVEYWFKTGVTNTALIEKKYDSILPIGDYITGGTQLGYFSGFTGIQTLPITNLPDISYNGNYNSLYNYYYRGTDGIIHIGIPSDNIQRRGYVKTSGIVKSWIWSDYVGGGDLVGWALIDGSIASQVGTFQYDNIYYDGSLTFPYSNTGWTTGVGYNNGSEAVVSTVVGSLTTGTTLTIGGRPFAFKDYNNLHFRTIVSDTPATLKVSDDNDALIHISGATSSMSAQNLSTFGSTVYSGQTGTTFLFKTIVGSGDTTITDLGTRLVIGSAGGSSATYNLSTPAAITVGGIFSGTQLTGKTSFQLFEELLVPTLQPTFVAPSSIITLLPASGTICEIGYIIPTLVLTSTFDRGSYTPAYCGGTSYGSGLPTCHVFTGKGSGISGTTVSTSLIIVKNAAGSSFTVSQGCSYFTTNVAYSAGLQANDSKGIPSTCPAVGAGTIGVKTACIVGAYPLWATCTTISICSKLSLYDMTNENAVPIILSPESGGYKQKFQVPCVWLISRPLIGICQFNTVSNLWEYPLGSQAASLTLWDTSTASELVQGNSIGYCEYKYNGVDRSSVCIRLVF